jgi:hypothetical protein
VNFSIHYADVNPAEMQSQTAEGFHFVYAERGGRPFLSLWGSRAWRVALLRQLAEAEGCVLTDGVEMPVTQLASHFTEEQITALADAVARGDA